MSETIGMPEFHADLARMDDRTLGLLHSLFMAQAPAARKLHRLCSLATPPEGEAPPRWYHWQFDISRDKKPGFTKELAELLQAELRRRDGAARELERARRNAFTVQDAKALTDAELGLIRMILFVAFDTNTRWQLLVDLGRFSPVEMRSSAWRNGPESQRDQKRRGWPPWTSSIRKDDDEASRHRAAQPPRRNW